MLAFSFQMFLTCLLFTATGFALTAMFHEDGTTVPKWVISALAGGVLSSLAGGVIFVLLAI